MDPYSNKEGYTDSPISGAILCHFEFIVDHLRRGEEVVLGLYSERLFTMDEKQRLASEQDTKGINAQVRLLLNMLLKKPETTQESFLGILNDRGSQALASLIKHHIYEIGEGIMPKIVNEAKLQGKNDNVFQLYSNQKHPSSTDLFIARRDCYHLLFGK